MRKSPKQDLAAQLDALARATDGARLLAEQGWQEQSVATSACLAVEGILALVVAELQTRIRELEGT